MDKLNELVELANKMGGESWCYTQSSIFSKGYITGMGGRTIVQTYNGDVPANACQFIRTADPATILEIAEAFRQLEQRAEAAETQLAELAKQKPSEYQYYYHNHGTGTGKWLPVASKLAFEQMKAKHAGDNDFSFRELFTRAAPATVPVDLVPDYFDRLVVAARARAEKAMRKFPQPNYVLNKVAEESGEVIKAVIHYTEGREDWLSVEGELIDNLAMLFRLVTEGDGVIGFSPPEEVVRRIEGRQC